MLFPRPAPGDPEAADALMTAQVPVTQIGKAYLGGIPFDILSKRLSDGEIAPSEVILHGWASRRRALRR